MLAVPSGSRFGRSTVVVVLGPSHLLTKGEQLGNALGMDLMVPRVRKDQGPSVNLLLTIVSWGMTPRHPSPTTPRTTSRPG